MDVKPGNVLLHPASQEAALGTHPWGAPRHWEFRGAGCRWRGVLADFGCANIARDSCRSLRGHAAIKREDGIQETTLPYRAPELVFGQPKFGVAVDVWSFAVVVAECVLHRPLFSYRKFTTPKLLRQGMIDHCGTKQPVEELRDMVLGVDFPWPAVPKEAQPWPDVVEVTLGPDGVDFLDKAMCLEPSRRLPSWGLCELA